MATTQHATLTANTVTTVDLGLNFGRVEVLNRDGAAEVYFTTSTADPTVAGANTHVLPAVIGSIEVDDETPDGAHSLVKLISTGTPKVSVRGL